MMLQLNSKLNTELKVISGVEALKNESKEDGGLSSSLPGLWGQHGIW